MALDLKQYAVSTLFPNNQPTHVQAPPFNVNSINIDPQMVVILVHVR
jgi:hypothetical protein